MPLIWIVIGIGWLLVALPVAVYIALTMQMVLGVAKDDDTIKGVVGLGVLMVVSGIVCLVLAYATDLIPASF